MSTLLAAGHVLIGAKVGPALAGMAKVNTAFAATAARGAKTGAAMSKAISLPIVAGFGFAIKAAADFESALNDMQAVSGATAAQMREVSKTAKALGADTKLPGTSAKDAAEAMTELAKGGFTAKQAMDAARGTLVLSAAAGVENAEAAKIQVKALNGFGLSAKSAGRVSDLLAASANASTAEITDMALSLSQSSAVAKQAGVPIEDAVTALSRLANAGIAGSDAGTSLKTMLLRLMAPMGSGAKAVKSLGLELRDAQGNLKSLPALADEFTAKTEGMTKAQRDAAFAAIFGSDAIRAANILLGDGSKAHEAMRDKVTKAGAAQELAASKMRGFNGALEAFKSAAETAAITIGTVLLPYATGLVRGLTNMVSGFESLSPSMQRFILVGLAAAAALGPVIILAGKLALGIKAIGAALALTASPIGLVVVALVALAAGFVYAYQNSETFRNIVNGAMEAIKSVAIPAIQAVGAALTAMAGWFQRHWGTIRSVTVGAINAIRTVIQAGIAAIRAYWTPAWPVLSAVVVAAWNIVASVVRTNLAVIQNLIRAVMAAIRGDWSGAWNALRAAAVAAITGAASTVKAILTGLRSVATALAKAIGTGIVNGVKAGLAALSTIYSVMWTAISGAVSAAASAAFGAAASIGRAIVNGALSGMGGLASALRSQAQGAVRSALSNLNPFSPVEHGGIKYIGQPIVKGALHGLNDLAPKMKAKITSAVRESILAARDSASSLSSGLSGMIGQGIDALAGSRIAANDNSPEAQRLRQIEFEQRSMAKARDRQRLDEAIANAETDDERRKAQQDLHDWVLDEERQHLSDVLAMREQQIRDEADAKKTAAERGLADLTSQLNRGLISQATYQQQVQALLAATAPDYATTGALLGQAFAYGFQQQVANLFAQTGLISRGPGAGMDFPAGLENPANVAAQEARKNALKAWTDKRDTLVDKLQDARAGLEKVNDIARKESSPGKENVTADEAKTIAVWAERAKNAQEALAAHNKAKPAKLGGVVMGAGLTDKVPLLTAPGEGVLNHRNMDRLMDMAMGGGGGGGGRETHLHFHVTGNTILGDDRSVGRRLAEIVAPELNRRIALAG